jgi:putative Mg2+ transporter-C (MgtC) family protein
MDSIATTDMVLRILTATALGAAVGLERERKEWVAGLRTHILVCMSAAIAMMVSTYGFNDVVGRNGIVLDPSRVAAQVISGVSFLGAGTILFMRQEVIRGLTTAAGLWGVAAIGLAVGGGMFMMAIMGTVIILFVLAGVKWIEIKWFNKQEILTIHITANHSAGLSVLTIENILSHNKLDIKRFSVSMDDHQEKDSFLLLLSKFNNRRKIIAAIDELKGLPGIVEVKF